MNIVPDIISKVLTGNRPAESAPGKAAGSRPFRAIFAASAGKDSPKSAVSVEDAPTESTAGNTDVAVTPPPRRGLLALSRMLTRSRAMGPGSDTSTSEEASASDVTAETAQPTAEATLATQRSVNADETDQQVAAKLLTGDAETRKEPEKGVRLSGQTRDSLISFPNERSSVAATSSERRESNAAMPPELADAAIPEGADSNGSTVSLQNIAVRHPRPERRTPENGDSELADTSDDSEETDVPAGKHASSPRVLIQGNGRGNGVPLMPSTAKSGEPPVQGVAPKQSAETDAAPPSTPDADPNMPVRGTERQSGPMLEVRDSRSAHPATLAGDPGRGTTSVLAAIQPSPRTASTRTNTDGYGLAQPRAPGVARRLASNAANGDVAVSPRPSMVLQDRSASTRTDAAPMAERESGAGRPRVSPAAAGEGATATVRPSLNSVSPGTRSDEAVALPAQSRENRAGNQSVLGTTGRSSAMQASVSNTQSEERSESVSGREGTTLSPSMRPGAVLTGSPSIRPRPNSALRVRALRALPTQTEARASAGRSAAAAVVSGPAVTQAAARVQQPRLSIRSGRQVASHESMAGADRPSISHVRLTAASPRLSERDRSQRVDTLLRATEAEVATMRPRRSHALLASLPQATTSGRATPSMMADQGETGRSVLLAHSAEKMPETVAAKVAADGVIKQSETATTVETPDTPVRIPRSPAGPPVKQPAETGTAPLSVSDADSRQLADGTSRSMEPMLRGAAGVSAPATGEQDLAPTPRIPAVEVDTVRTNPEAANADADAVSRRPSAPAESAGVLHGAAAQLLRTNSPARSSERPADPDRTSRLAATPRSTVLSTRAVHGQHGVDREPLPVHPAQTRESVLTSADSAAPAQTGVPNNRVARDPVTTTSNDRESVSEAATRPAPSKLGARHVPVRSDASDASPVGPDSLPRHTVITDSAPEPVAAAVPAPELAPTMMPANAAALSRTPTQPLARANVPAEISSEPEVLSEGRLEAGDSADAQTARNSVLQFGRGFQLVPETAMLLGQARRFRVRPGAQGTQPVPDTSFDQLDSQVAALRFEGRIRQGNATRTELPFETTTALRSTRATLRRNARESMSDGAFENEDKQTRREGASTGAAAKAQTTQPTRLRADSSLPKPDVSFFSASRTTAARSGSASLPTAESQAGLSQSSQLELIEQIRTHFAAHERVAGRSDRMAFSFQSDELGTVHLAIREQRNSRAMEIVVRVENVAGSERVTAVREEIIGQIRAMGYENVSLSVSTGGAGDRRRQDSRRDRGNADPDNVKLPGSDADDALFSFELANARLSQPSVDSRTGSRASASNVA